MDAKLSSMPWWLVVALAGIVLGSVALAAGIAGMSEGGGPLLALRPIALL